MVAYAYAGGLLGGVLIKLKMGKTVDAPDEKITEEKTEEQNKTPPETQELNDNSEPVVEDVESLRTVIKLDENGGGSEVGEKSEEKEEKKEEKPDEDIDLDGVGDLVEESEETGSTASASSREALEQKRALLQRIKDFDLQIKKNQQDINDVSDKMNAISKDLDDLVSLYEIVSEQMNPFVGLSKVTKKRLESFETIHRELGEIKEKISIIESGGNFDFSEVKSNGELDSEIDPTLEPATPETELEAETSEEEPVPEIDSTLEPVAPETELEAETSEEEPVPEIDSIYETVQSDSGQGIDSLYDFDLTDEDVNQILEMSFSKIPSENQVDRVIDEYIESLKAG